MSFLDLQAELTGTIPGLSPILAQKYINRALAKVYGERLWSFLLTDGGVVLPTQITAGTAAYAQFTTGPVTMNAAASAALLAQANETTEPGLTNLQIRFGAPAATSPAISQVYNIEVVDFSNPAAIVLTLDRIIMEATATASSYQVYRAYIVPPIPDFLAWQSIVDMVNAFPLRTNVTSSMFDLRDPQRQAQGLGYFVGSYSGGYIPNPITNLVVPNPNIEPGNNVYEVWPHSTQGQTLYVRMRRRGVPFTSPGDTQPAAIPDELILSRAYGWYVYPYVLANRANFPQFKNPDVPTLIRQAQAQYIESLQDAKRQDDETALQNVWSTGHGLRQGVRDFKGISDFPIDANYMQSHLVRF